MTSAEIDKALAEWLPPSVVSSVKKKLHDPMIGYPNDPERNWEAAGYDLEINFGAEEGQEAKRILELLNERAGRDFCAKELARLKVLTKAAKQDGDDVTFQIAVMADELIAYPSDVVRDACRFWPTQSQWFPSWHELRALCEERVLKRRSLLDALRRYFEAVK